jgi:hypothetical protein
MAPRMLRRWRQLHRTRPRRLLNDRITPHATRHSHRAHGRCMYVRSVVGWRPRRERREETRGGREGRRDRAWTRRRTEGSTRWHAERGLGGPKASESRGRCRRPGRGGCCPKATKRGLGRGGGGRRTAQAEATARRGGAGGGGRSPESARCGRAEAARCGRAEAARAGSGPERAAYLLAERWLRLLAEAAAAAEHRPRREGLPAVACTKCTTTTTARDEPALCARVLPSSAEEAQGPPSARFSRTCTAAAARAAWPLAGLSLPPPSPAAGAARALLLLQPKPKHRTGSPPVSRKLAPIHSRLSIDQAGARLDMAGVPLVQLASCHKHRPLQPRGPRPSRTGRHGRSAISRSGYRWGRWQNGVGAS